MEARIGNCTAIAPDFGSCRRIGAYWDQSAEAPNCTWGMAEGSFDGFYLYSGVESTNTTSSALQQSFDWVTVRKHFPHGEAGSTTNPSPKPTLAPTHQHHPIPKLSDNLDTPRPSTAHQRDEW